VVDKSYTKLYEITKQTKLLRNVTQKYTIHYLEHAYPQYHAHIAKVGAFLGLQRLPGTTKDKLGLNLSSRVYSCSARLYCLYERGMTATKNLVSGTG
jgi:hypothetical protein